MMLMSEPATNVTWVLVGEPGNPRDAATKLGRVDQVFEIMATEVPNRRYCDFLNAVARRGDPFGLYSPLLADHFFGGIVRTGGDGAWRYDCKPGYENLPAVFVSWFDAARFANWLHFGQPGDTICGLGTTEGDAVNGAYDTRDFPDARAAARSARRRNAGARYWLPDQDEWVKAGFYGGSGKWWRYATQSDDLPRSCPPAQAGAPAPANTANYYAGTWAAPFPHLTPVGAYASKSWFGTYDQAGNAMEWVESLIPDGRGFRKALGGSLFRHANALERGYAEGDHPGKKLSTFGFRVARCSSAASLPPVVRPFAVASQPVTGASTPPPPPEYVRVGDPGNPSDPFYGRLGTVDYVFEMARCKISNAEYADFLNAVATTTDPFGLYSSDMASGALGGIVREARDNAAPYRYRAKAGWERRPVNYISWFDLARYANWQHFGKPRTGCSEAGTTEGSAVSGAYDTRRFEDLRAGRCHPWRDFGRRNVGARYWIPDENEWYKAAYYDPGRMGARPYWDYPVRSDDLPANPPPPGNERSVNYQRGDRLAIGPPYYLAEVDAYPLATSHYGTLQQGGNVWEWLESWQYGGRVVGTRGLRGGSFGYTELGLHACNCDPGGLNERTYVFGGRLARAVDADGWQRPRVRLAVACRRKLAAMNLRDWLLLAACAGGAGLLIGMGAGWLIRAHG